MPTRSVDLTSGQKAAIEALSGEQHPIHAPLWLAREAVLGNDELDRRLAASDPDQFWREQSRLVDWDTPFEEVSRINLPKHEWFVGGKLNASVNCIDRHVHTERRLKAALIWVGEDGNEVTYTYGRLYREVGRFGNALRKLGVKKGDRVVIYMPLVPEGVVAMLACARIGAIHSVVFAGMGTQALKARIIDSGAKVVVCSDFAYRRGKPLSLKPAVDEAVRELGSVEHVVVHRRGSRPGDAPIEHDSEREHDFYDVQDARAIHCKPESMDAEDPLFILYTSGTTGKPKGVVHATGGYLVGVTYLSKAFFQIGERDIYWSTSDIGWIVGHSFIVYGPLSIGATVLIREGVPDFPTPEVTWELCERHGVNIMFTAPTAVRMWMSHGATAPGKYDLSRLRLIACAGEPLNPEAHRWAQKHLVGQANGLVVDNWWQTEIAAPVLGTLPTFDPRPGKVGKPLPGVEAAIVDGEGNSVPDGTGGLLVLRKPLPYMLRTVWGDHSRYEQYWTAQPGMYSAGDIAVRDADGYFSVLGRADDVLNVAGHRIGTADIEASLATHASVAESAAIGLPDPLKGERIKVFVVLKPGLVESPSLLASLRDHVRAELGAIATPSEGDTADQIPFFYEGFAESARDRLPGTRVTYV
jgi:acetyl-CoA synthetase